MATPNDDDPTRATLRVAEGVVGLVRAELGLAFAQARSSVTSLGITLALAIASLFAAGLAVVIIVLTPMFWTRSPSAALVTLGISLTFALATFVATLVRLHRHKKPSTGERPNASPLVSRRDHAIPR
jgi:hypothetical protein